jgi:23S rRNA (adenine2503-C2)-methyltransferase
MDSLISFYSCTQSQYVEKVLCSLKKGERHARDLYSAGFKSGSLDPNASWIEPQAMKLVQDICSMTDMTLPKISLVVEEGEVSKFLLKYADGLESESVLIPMKFGKTLCVSSQVGCRMACAFCETGKMGLLRNLTASEIVSQVFIAKFILKAEVRNLVFMGMGEPFDNYEEVMQAISVLTCPSGMGISPKNITVSTSGRVDEIYRFSREVATSLKLAVSLNAPNDHIRSKLMPVNKDWNLSTLKEAMQEYLKNPKRIILVEYVLIAGVNDSPEDALEVSQFLKGLRVKVNLIPYNSQSKGRLQAPSEEKMEEFRRILKREGYSVFLRIAKGNAIMAACGQLGNRDLKKNPGVKSSLSLL